MVSGRHDWVHDGRTTTFTLVGDGRPDEEWWLPGGGVEPGETAGEALQRELDEEAGASVDALELLAYRRVEDPVDGEHLIATYWARIRMNSEFEPRHEITHHLLVEPRRFLDNLWWSDDPAAARLLSLATDRNGLGG